MKQEFRKTLEQLEQSSQTAYDKTLITLSSGGLVLSVTFLTQLDRVQSPALLIGAWVAWGSSLVIMLVGFLAAVHACRTGQAECDSPGIITPTGGLWEKMIIPANWGACILFVIGLTLMLWFASLNQGGTTMAESAPKPNPKQPTPDTHAAPFPKPPPANPPPPPPKQK